MPDKKKCAENEKDGKPLGWRSAMHGGSIFRRYALFGWKATE